ncbi:granzyme H-like isoform X2 [Ochotona curzoniae]|uniref:granzyme H-like isoform X2 n=1 Tax=Ochotona curzoniae TaxID=130825 RepID=UPI001B34A062|nr:granzyme H-like isoform X2 [Ochotona curzoniae]
MKNTSHSDRVSPAGKMLRLLLLWLLLLLPGAGTEEIIGGQEVKPHSRPYMVLVRSLATRKKRCSGVLVREDFVLTAAHCQGSSMNVTLGAHNIKKPEKTQQVIPVRRAIPHPNYNPRDFSGDIMLLQLEKKIKRTAAIQPLSLPRGRARGDSGGPLVCNNMAQGIFSYGQQNRSPPGVFIKVSHFLPWIKRTMRDH